MLYRVSLQKQIFYNHLKYFDVFDQQFLSKKIITEEDKIFRNAIIELLSNQPDKKHDTDISVIGSNYSKQTFLKTLPRIKKDLNIFKFAVSQATFEYQQYLYFNDIKRFYELIMTDELNYDNIHPKMLKMYKDEIPQKIKVHLSSSKFDL